jgi:dephospho-CoA kinase
MILVGLTGGIGSGKSTVAGLLAAKGAVIIDADQITREFQRPGEPMVTAIAERFGTGVLTASGALDRAALASIVFSDAEALKDLNRLVHPAVRKEMASRVDAQRDSDRVVVLDIPLLTENPRPDLAATIVVDAPVEVAVDRLVRLRGMSEQDALARIAKQASREERWAIADWVIDNSADMEHLEDQVDDLWVWLQRLVPPAVESPSNRQS